MEYNGVRLGDIDPVDWGWFFIVDIMTMPFFIIEDDESNNWW